MAEKKTANTLPVLPLKNSALFPFLPMPLAVGRPSSVAAVEAALGTEEQEILIVAQRDSSQESPRQGDLYTVGTKAAVRKVSRGEHALEILVIGLERVSILGIVETEPYLRARVQPLPTPDDSGPEVEALQREVLQLASQAVSIAQPQASQEISRMLAGSEDPLRLVYFLASLLSLDLAKEQSLLEAQTRADALRLMHSYLRYEVQVLELRSKIAGDVQNEMGKEQRDYFLRQQLRAIQQELGERSPEQAEIDLLRERLEKAGLPEEAQKEATRELNRLERLPAAAPDHHIIRTYLEFLCELPWNTSIEGELDIARTREILDEDHYDLTEVKERILEHLAVLKLNPGAKAPILCFVGPPGVGKTSLGQSIARAMGRKFERISLGGMHDEAELRGHRRTYVGAMTGRILQAVRRAGANNPVMMLDEVDKLGRDFRGDPAAALLEILDPEQNKNFRDNYLDLAFDLSKVFFLTTANTLDSIPRPLLDRMELLRLAGYSSEEKMAIARRYLIPRQLKETGLTAEDCVFTGDGLAALIARYTREAGLRQLERAIASVARKVALRRATGQLEPVEVKPEDLADLLGPERFFPEQARKQLQAGVSTGLAWTEAGGEVLYIESILLPESTGLTLTGQLGEVMQESAKAAQSYVRSHAADFGVDAAVFQKSGVHIHIPAGAVPKDGPSAGVALAAALTSLYTGKAVDAGTAMTGEITLTGLVLPVGGVKEKVLAARRAGITRIVLPKPNRKDLRDIPEDVRRDMEFVFVEEIQEALRALIPTLAGAE
jgi:ATP-dependent Lon protease